jgi:anthranilate/para-aminobenzoate synthase component II
MILLIDNYDSFVYNLARYVGRLGRERVVVRNDAITLDEIAALQPEAIILSPGPCGPAEAGICVWGINVLAPYLAASSPARRVLCMARQA